MSIIVKERSDSQGLQAGGDRGVETTYDIFKRRGPSIAPMQYAEAEYALLVYAPYAIENPESENALVRRDYRIDFIDGYTAKGSISYGYLDPRKIPGPVDPDQNISFQVHAETVHIQQSFGIVDQKRDTTKLAALIDTEGVIGATEKGDIDGCDVITPRLQFSLTKHLAPDVVSHNYVKALAGIVGTVNSNVFRTFLPGEVMLTGLQGAFNYDKQRWELSFTFSCSPNLTGIVIGGIDPIDKRGHDYLWVAYKVDTDTGSSSLVPQPMQANVERVYQYTDYSVLGLG